MLFVSCVASNSIFDEIIWIKWSIDCLYYYDNDIVKAHITRQPITVYCKCNNYNMANKRLQLFQPKNGLCHQHAL